MWRRHHCRWMTIFRPMLDRYGLWIGRDLYSATNCGIRFWGEGFGPMASHAVYCTYCEQVVKCLETGYPQQHCVHGPFVYCLMYILFETIILFILNIDISWLSQYNHRSIMLYQWTGLRCSHPPFSIYPHPHYLQCGRKWYIKCLKNLNLALFIDKKKKKKKNSLLKNKEMDQN